MGLLGTPAPQCSTAQPGELHTYSQTGSLLHQRPIIVLCRCSWSCVQRWLRWAASRPLAQPPARSGSRGARGWRRRCGR